MFSTMPLQVFRDDTLPSFIAPTPPYRPTRSSPLSSSPIRPCASPPLSPRHPNISLRETQSSPIPARHHHPSSIFSSKFAARPTRPNPVAQKREAAQESRRKLFLKNVRQRAEDQRFARRGGEQEWLKLEWESLNKDRRQAKNADVDGVVFESDIEDAARLRDEAMHRPGALSMTSEASASGERSVDVDMDADDMLVDLLEQEHQAELEAMAEAMAPRVPSSSERQHVLDSPEWDDEEDYDALFMDLLAQEQQQGPVHSQDVDMDLS